MDHFGHSKKVTKKKSDSSQIIAMAGSAKELSEDKKEALVNRDEILQRLLEVSDGNKSCKVVSRHYFHDALIDQEAKIDNGENESNVELSQCS